MATAQIVQISTQKRTIERCAERGVFSLPPLVEVKIQRELSVVTIQTCNARDLWLFIESKQEFANWIKGRIEKYGFVEGEDFTVDKFINRRATVIDYHLTMTSREIAELTGKRHPDVRRDIRNMLEALKKDVSSFAHTYTDSVKRTVERCSEKGVFAIPPLVEYRDSAGCHVQQGFLLPPSSMYV